MFMSATSQKRNLACVILFTLNYCSFANGDVSSSMGKTI